VATDEFVVVAAEPPTVAAEPPTVAAEPPTVAAEPPTVAAEPRADNVKVDIVEAVDEIITNVETMATVTKLVPADTGLTFTFQPSTDICVPTFELFVQLYGQKSKFFNICGSEMPNNELCTADYVFMLKLANACLTKNTYTYRGRSYELAPHYDSPDSDQKCGCQVFGCALTISNGVIIVKDGVVIFENTIPDYLNPTQVSCIKIPAEICAPMFTQIAQIIFDNLKD
jgi:hypothetical protein